MIRSLILLLLAGYAVGQTSVNCHIEKRVSVAFDNPAASTGDWVLDPFTRIGCDPQPKPEPMDVPAIRPIIDGENNGGFCSCPKNTVSAGICAENTLPKCFKAWTCAEKSRILMTSEDGERHCIRFPK